MFELTFEGDLARLRLARPEVRNAISLAGWKLLVERVAEAAERGARLLLVSGDASAFSAGADIGEFPAMRADPALRTAFRLAMRGGIEAVADASMPTVALIEGPCYGAAVALAMACDLRIGGPGAVFAITPAKFGISYPQEDVHRLVSLVGRGQAARLLLTAQAIDASEARQLGLVDILTEDAPAAVESILAGSSASHADLRRAIRLAAAGVASDPEQDRRFEALFGSDELARRLPRR